MPERQQKQRKPKLDWAFKQAGPRAMTPSPVQKLPRGPDIGRITGQYGPGTPQTQTIRPGATRPLPLPPMATPQHQLPFQRQAPNGWTPPYTPPVYTPPAPVYTPPASAQPPRYSPPVYTPPQRPSWTQLSPQQQFQFQQWAARNGIVRR